MSDAPLIAHSIAEARLYLMVTPCKSCRRGPLQPSGLRRLHESGGVRVVAIDTTCDCAHADTFTFRITADSAVNEPNVPALINVSPQRSRIIDVAQWLTLFRMTAEEAGRESDKVQARELWLEAAQCLEEALKFFDDAENDLPPEDAFYHAESRVRLRENPEQFSRSRLIGLRAKLPVRGAAVPRVSTSGPKPQHKEGQFP